MSHSFVVTGGGRGIGRALVERLLRQDDVVVAIELDPDTLAWINEHPAGSRVIPVVGDAADETVQSKPRIGRRRPAPSPGGSTTPPCSGMLPSTRLPPGRCWTPLHSI